MSPKTAIAGENIYLLVDLRNKDGKLVIPHNDTI